MLLLDLIFYRSFTLSLARRSVGWRLTRQAISASCYAASAFRLGLSRSYRFSISLIICCSSSAVICIDRLFLGILVVSFYSRIGADRASGIGSRKGNVQGGKSNLGARCLNLGGRGYLYSDPCRQPQLRHGPGFWSVGGL